MGDIAVGANSIADLRLGANQIQRVLQGATEIWTPGGGPPAGDVLIPGNASAPANSWQLVGGVRGARADNGAWNTSEGGTPLSVSFIPGIANGDFVVLCMTGNTRPGVPDAPGAQPWVELWPTGLSQGAEMRAEQVVWNTALGNPENNGTPTNGANMSFVALVFRPPAIVGRRRIRQNGSGNTVPGPDRPYDAGQDVGIALHIWYSQTDDITSITGGTPGWSSVSQVSADGAPGTTTGIFFQTFDPPLAGPGTIVTDTIGINNAAGIDNFALVTLYYN